METRKMTADPVPVIISVIIFLLVTVVLYRAFLKKSNDQSNTVEHSTANEVQAAPQETETKSTVVVAAPAKEKSLKEALAETEKSFFGRIRSVFSSEKSDYLEEIEEVLYTSDLGPKTVQTLLQNISSNLKKSEKADVEKVRLALNSEIKSIFAELPHSESNQVFKNQLEHLKLAPKGTSVWIIVGVNGAGKTTTIGKVSALIAGEGKKVLVAAGDTFRAAAQSQLKAWTDRAQVEIFDPPQTLDPSAVAFDAVTKAVAREYDVVIIDTAGRLHTQANLMEELKKMKRVIQKVLPDAPHEVLLVLDANSGQNALIQAKEFNQALQVTGVVLTKMDGTAKGGVAVGLAHEHKLPIKLIGVGEKIQDLRAFNANEFVDSII